MAPDCSHNTTAAGHFEALIVAHCEVAPGHFRLTVDCAEIATHARAGQFVHVLPRAGTSSDPLLRRAFSVMATRAGSFDILYRVLGRGTQAMSRWRVGERVSLVGPLGHPFASLAPRSLLVGGGVGVPPLAMLACQRASEDVIALLGARSRADVLCEEDFAHFEVPVRVATDDGSAGHHGLVTMLLEQELSASTWPSRDVAVFTCGPLPMLRRVAEICAQLDVTCHVSLEEVMPCGVGVCNGCVVPVRALESASHDEYSLYRRTCVEGPVFAADQIDWEKLSHG